MCGLEAHDSPRKVVWKEITRPIAQVGTLSSQSHPSWVAGEKGGHVGGHAVVMVAVRGVAG